MQIRNLLPGNRFCLGPLSVRKADSQERFIRISQKQSNKRENNWATGQTIGQEQLSNQLKTFVWWDRKQSSDRPNNRPKAIERPKVENEWTNNGDQRLGKAKRNWTSNQTINQTNNWKRLFGKANNDCKWLIDQTQERLQTPPISNEVWNRWEFWIRG